MPGHVKLGAGGGEDPDPSPYLMVSLEMKREAQAKPYDSKKSVWCPDGAGGFSEAMLESDDGKKATVMVGHEVMLINREIHERFKTIKFIEKGVQIRGDWTSKPSKV